MARKVTLTGALGAVLLAGAARAEVDMKLVEEAARDRAIIDHESHTEKLRMDAIRGVASSPALGLPYDESSYLKSLQADIYASAADLISPLPDRLSVDPKSPFYGEYGNVGVRFNGSDRHNDVEEYCVSEGWIRVRTFMTNGKPKKERGKFVCLRRHGKVEPYRK